MEDKMVELTRFTKVSEAEILANLLRSEGVDCYVRNGFIHQIYGIDLGGVIVELLEKNLESAIEIMEDYGYTTSCHSSDKQILESDGFNNSNSIASNDDSEFLENLAVSEDVNDETSEYMQNRAMQSKKMTVITVIIVLLVVIIILVNKLR